MGSFFVRRPIVAIVISIVMIIVGAVAMSGLPVAQFPEIVPPMFQVSTSLQGASATDVVFVQDKENGWLEAPSKGDGAKRQ